MGYLIVFISSMSTERDSSPEPYPIFTPEQLALLELKNFDESRVGPLHLPDPLLHTDGRPVTSAEEWFQQRQPQLKNLFEQYVYGRMLPAVPVHAEEVEQSNQAFNGQATRIQTELRVAGLTLNVIIYLPNPIQQPVPCFLGMNFTGNHAAFDDPAIPLSTRWMLDQKPGIVDSRSTEDSRATATSRWPVEMILSRGYGVATLYYGDVEPDHPRGYSEGPRAHFLNADSNEEREADEAGAITSWAWGLSRVMDYLQTVPQIDSKRVCLTGHSRLGKTALWASACDPRFALVVANNSGCGGAALSCRNFGETYYILSNARTYWFSKTCVEQSRDTTTFPVDQHMLIALSAPRPVFVSSAEDDHAADPKGEFLGLKHASPVYRLVGTDGLQADAMPPLSQPVLSRLGYWIRPGGHNITPEDWKVHLDFADRQLA